MMRSCREEEVRLTFNIVEDRIAAGQDEPEKDNKPDEEDVGSKEKNKKEDADGDNAKNKEDKEQGSKEHGSSTTGSKVTRSKLSEDPKSKVIEGRFTSTLAAAVTSVTLASFQFGYHIGCVNAPGGLITDWIIQSHREKYNVTLDKQSADLTWSTIVAVFGVGGAIGGLISGFIADKCGRRNGLLCTNVLVFVATAMMAFVKIFKVYWTMVVGRLLIGIYAGLTILVPMYLTEVPPTNLRGMIGSLHQLLVTIGILVSQVVGLPMLFGTQSRWPFIFGIAAIPALIQVISLPLIPESPKFTLCFKGQVEQATKDLEKLRGTTDVAAEIDMMREEALGPKGQSAAEEHLTFGDMFRGDLRWPMTIAVFLMIAQQLSGINAVMFYSTVIFKQAGLTDENAVYATIGVGIVNVLMTVVSVWLVDHPRFGRRSLLLFGMIGMWISTLLLVVCISTSMNGAKWGSYGAIFFIMLFVISFAAGAAQITPKLEVVLCILQNYMLLLMNTMYVVTGSIPWFFVSEIFFSNARANANSVATLTNWSSNVVVGLLFLPINNLIQQYTFLVFTGFLTLFTFFIYKYVPETKGKTTEEINAELHQ
ncbi:MFS transporter, SP family [Dictyocaulus viviparus]|uniref:MFS transporter, SP family n=1 Tax=Dictyocaulus viviparus TaxID=29172 RepID=A0A0D8Y4F7_DICVI|nr:MFS transporter, SP family [Dictyocaulus viviparus]